jgi:cation diffusion facilitator CzcD-associated flavoprotein CzcO
MSTQDGARPAAKSELALRVAVIGAGMSGILTAIKLREAGIDDFTVYEKAEGLGGTWRDNTYPGLSCDVPSHLYRYSFEPNPEWSHLFSPGAEIQDYLEQVARKYGVAPLIEFATEISKAEYVEGRWRLETRDGKTDIVDVVIAASGVLREPAYPDIEGLESFAGATFHRHRLHGDPDRAGHRRPGRQGRALSAHRPMDHADGQSRLQRGGEGRVPPRTPADGGALPVHLRALGGQLRARGGG